VLPGDDRLQRLIDVVGPLAFSSDLPTAEEEYFAETGMLPTIPDERRRHVRTKLRVAAALKHRQSLPALARDEQWHKIVVRDISRGGVSFLHGQQLYPIEQLILVMPDCRPRGIEIKRCRRIRGAFYEIGAIFVKEFRSLAIDAPEQSRERTRDGMDGQTDPTA